MPTLKEKIDQAIIITGEGQPHKINIPILKSVLSELADIVNLLELKFDSHLARLHNENQLDNDD